MDSRAGTSFLWALAATLAWFTLYFSLSLLNSKRSLEWHCRVVTIIHAILVTSLSAWCGFVQGPWPFTDPGGPATPLQRVTVTICLGYFFYDLLWCLYHQTEGVIMLLHHLMSILGNGLVLYRGKFGTEMIATIFGSEMTNPFLQMRWILRETNRHQTWYAEVNDVIFMALFGFLRVGIGSKLLYCYLNHSRPEMITKVGGVLFYILSWVWWLLIVRYAIKKYTKMYRVYKSGRSAEQTQNGVSTSNGTPKDSVDLTQGRNGYVHIQNGQKKDQ